MKRLTPVLVAALAFAGAAAPAAAETEHVTRTVSLGPGGTLHLNSFSGRVTIAGTDQSDVVIDAVRHGTRDQLDRITLDIQADGSSVRIEANRRERSWFDWGRDNVVETDLDIKVPRRTNLDIKLFSASLDVRRVEGSHTVNTFSSHATLDEVTGSVHAKSFSGPIEVRASTWQDRQTIDVETFSGNVQLHLPESARGSVNFNSFSGRLNTSLPVTVQSSRRKEFSGQLGQGGDGRGAIRVRTFSGNATLDR